MKKSFLIVSILTALSLCACSDDNDSNQSEGPVCEPACQNEQVCVDLDANRKNVCANKCEKAGTTSNCTEVDGRGAVSSVTCGLAADGKTLVDLQLAGAYQCEIGVGCNADKTDCATTTPVVEPKCDPACEGAKVCVDLDENRKNICADKCEKAGTTSTCTEVDGRGAVSSVTCGLAADGKTIVDLQLAGAYQCEIGVGCNADKTDCATTTPAEGPKCDPACKGDKVCVDLDENRKNVCADKCEKAGTTSTCTEVDGRGAVSSVTCGLAADGKTIVDLQLVGAYQCEEGVGCNADKTDCADDDPTECTEDLCEEGYECKMAKVEDAVSPVCVDKNAYCQNKDEAGSKCSDDNQAIISVLCFEEAEGNKLLKVTATDKCKQDKVCGEKDGKVECLANTDGPDQPAVDPEIGKHCDATYAAKCNDDGTLWTCFDGKILTAGKPTDESKKDYKCHVFANKGIAQYVDEKECTLLENGVDTCDAVLKWYGDATCAKADDDKFHWYYDYKICEKGCTTSGCNP